MGFFGQFIQCLISHRNRGTSRKGHSCFFLQIFQFIIQLVIFKVTHDLPVFLIIGLGSLLKHRDQFFHSLYLIHQGSLL